MGISRRKLKIAAIIFAFAIFGTACKQNQEIDTDQGIEMDQETGTDQGNETDYEEQISSDFYETIDFATLPEALHVQFESEMDMEVLDDYLEIVTSEDNYASNIVLWTDVDLYEVELVGVNYDNLEFTADKSFGIEREIAKNTGIIYTHALSSGAIPNTAIIIRDKDGKEKSFLLHESGYDGSLILTEEQVIYQVNEDQ